MDKISEKRSVEELKKCQQVLTTTKYRLQFQRVLEFVFTNWLLLVKHWAIIHQLIIILESFL